MSNRFTNLNAENAIIDSLTRFQGFHTNIYKDPFVGGHAFIFMTKPLLFLDPIKGSNAHNSDMAYLNMTRDPFFSQYLIDQAMNDADKQIIKMLSYNTEYSKSSFIPIITNECKNFTANDTTVDTSDYFDTKQGFKETLPTNKTMSEAASTLTISVTEDSNLSFTKMMSIWVNYITNVVDGTFDANPDCILDGSIDYMSSIYYFVLAPDGKTLKYWAKYTGCFPTTIPYSSVSYSKGQQDAADITLSFVFNVKEDMSPKILEEFNILSLKLVGTAVLKDKSFVKEINGQYSSIKESPLLNLNELTNLPVSATLRSEERDPLVLYVPGNNKGVNPDSTSDRFELIFDDTAYKSNIFPDVFGGDNYYLNDTATNFVKNMTYNEDPWDQTDFWSEETIE